MFLPRRLLAAPTELSRNVMLEGTPNDSESQRSRKPTYPQDQLRIRAAWLYHIDGLTQSEVAEKLGVSRIMITRLLAAAKKRGEVVVRIKSELAPLVELQHKLENRYDLDQVIVAPLESEKDDPTRVIAAAAASHVSQCMTDGLTVGVGWGRTMHTMLTYLEGKPLDDVRVVSLLSGDSEQRGINPAEFAWQFAELFEAEPYLISAPAFVDSAETKHALLVHCGLDRVLQMAESCDIALLSCGGISALTTAYWSGHISETERQSMIAVGAVGDVLYHFLDETGKPLDHPVNGRSISVPIDRLRAIPRKVMMSGGPEKVTIILAALKVLNLSVLITDEVTARALLA